MKRQIVVAIAAVSMSLPSAPVLGSMWDTVKEAGKDAGSAVKSGAESVGNAAGDTVKDVTSRKTPAETRAAIDAGATKTLARLFRESTGAKKLYDVSYGYAFFDTRKVSIMITTGFGAGVAVAKGPGARTYMKMATGGVNLGVGGELFQLVFLFENAKSFRNFVDNGWEAGAEANATLGKASLAATPRFVEGMAVFQLTEAGVMLDLNFTGTKYWKDKKLNES